MAQEKSMFDKIKKQNGERFAKAVRNYDNGIFDIPNIDKIVKFAGREAEPIMNYLVSMKDIKIEEHGVYQDPITLLREAGYVAYYADTLEKQNKIQPFFAEGEELCTFRDDSRYERYYIINAVKTNAKDLHRKDFKNPRREDEYGTSVISIQVLKQGGFISIKNRYNHTVANPDNTFNSNPDNIIQGLSESIKHHFNVDFSSQREQLPDGYVLMGGQILRYNHEVGNVYFGEDFYADAGVVYELDKAKELMLDMYILDLSSKEIKNPSNYEDGFIAALAEEIEGEDKKLQVRKNENGNKTLQVNGAEILELEHGKIVSLNFPNVKTIGDRFLYFNEVLEKISLPKVRNLRDSFLGENKALKEINLPNVEEIEDFFLEKNEVLEKISLPNVLDIGYDFLYKNRVLSEINLPKVRNIGKCFLFCNKTLKKISLPNVLNIGYSFLYCNEALEIINFPKVDKIGSCFLENNKILTEINLPKVQTIGAGFLYCNRAMTEINLPNVKTIGENFLSSHPQWDKLNPMNQKLVMNQMKGKSGR